MDKNTAVDVVALIGKIQKDIDGIDLTTASSAQVSGLLEDFKTLEAAMAETDNPAIKMLGGLIGVTGQEIQAAYEAAQVREGLIAAPISATPLNQSQIDELKERMDQLDKKVQALRNISDDDITPEILKEIVEEGRALKKDIDATNNPLARFIGGLLESESLSVLEEAYEGLLKENQSDVAQDSSASAPPADKGPQPTLFEVRQIFTKFQAKVKKVLAKGEAASVQDTQEVVDMAHTLNDYAQINSSEQLSAIISDYLKTVKIDGVQEMVRNNNPQSIQVSDDMALELINSFKKVATIAEEKGDGLHYTEVQNLIAEFKKVKHVLDNGAFDTPENKQAMEEMLDGITLEDLEDISLQVVELEASKHSDPERLFEIEQTIEEYSTKMQELSSTKLNAEQLEEVKTVMGLGNELQEYANAHPSRISNLIKDVLSKSNFEGLKKAFEQEGARKFTNGKFDLFEDGFITQCQKYFEDLAVNASKKSKKYLQEAAQVMKGLPEDFKGLRAETSEEKEFIENLPGQTVLLSKIIERELKLKDKAVVKKAAKNEDAPAKKNTKTKKTDAPATKKRAKV